MILVYLGWNIRLEEISKSSSEKWRFKLELEWAALELKLEWTAFKLEWTKFKRTESERGESTCVNRFRLSNLTFFVCQYDHLVSYRGLLPEYFM